MLCSNSIKLYQSQPSIHVCVLCILASEEPCLNGRNKIEMKITTNKMFTFDISILINCLVESVCCRNAKR